MFAFRLPLWWPLNLTSPVIPQTPLWVPPLDPLKCLILYRVWRPCLWILSRAIQTAGFMLSSRKERRMVNSTSLSQSILMYYSYKCEVFGSFFPTIMYQITIKFKNWNLHIKLFCLHFNTCMHVLLFSEPVYEINHIKHDYIEKVLK